MTPRCEKAPLSKIHSPYYIPFAKSVGGELHVMASEIYGSLIFRAVLSIHVFVDNVFVDNAI